MDAAQSASIAEFNVTRMHFCGFFDEVSEFPKDYRVAPVLRSTVRLNLSHGNSRYWFQAASNQSDSDDVGRLPRKRCCARSLWHCKCTLLLMISRVGSRQPREIVAFGCRVPYNCRSPSSNPSAGCNKSSRNQLPPRFSHPLNFRPDHDSTTPSPGWRVRLCSKRFAHFGLHCVFLFPSRWLDCCR